MSFVPAEFLTSLATLDRETADKQPFGVVKLDHEGRVLLYNKYESELGKVAVSEAEGKIFFTQVAPCTNNKLFKGRFERGVAEGKLDTQFNYTFTYKLRPTNVAVRVYICPETNTNWLFIQKR